LKFKSSSYLKPHLIIQGNNSNLIFRYNANEIEWINKASLNFKIPSRNSKRQGKLEQLNTDGMVFHQEGNNSRNKYSNQMIANNYSDQRNTYDIGKKESLLLFLGSRMFMNGPNTGSNNSKLFYKGIKNFINL